MFSLDSTSLTLLILAGILGTIGLYLVLPQRLGRGKPGAAHAIGAGLAIAALLILASFWIGPRFPLDRLFFYAFGLLALGGGVLMISSRDPVNSALWFAVVVLSASGLLLLAGGQFLAAGTVIVYAGAIIVTFLFVIMLAQSHGRATYDRSSRAPLVTSICGMVMLVGISSGIVRSRQGPPPIPVDPPIERRIVAASDIPRLTNAPESSPLFQSVDRAVPATARLPVSEQPKRPPAHVAGLGATLWIDHLVTVQVVGVILFVALIGACSYATNRLAGKNRAGASSPDTAAAGR